MEHNLIRSGRARSVSCWNADERRQTDSVRDERGLVRKPPGRGNGLAARERRLVRTTHGSTKGADANTRASSRGSTTRTCSRRLEADCRTRCARSGQIPSRFTKRRPMLDAPGTQHAVRASNSTQEHATHNANIQAGR